MNDISSIYLFIFYNKAVGKQVRYIRNKKYLHCNIIVFDGKHYVLLEVSTSGIDFRIVRTKSLLKLIGRLKTIESIESMICLSTSSRYKSKWFPLCIKSCNEFCKSVAAVDIGFTYDPVHLYKKLLKYDNQKNFEILYAWERSNG